MGGMVRFPVQPHSHEKIRVSMWRLHPDLPILGWKSYSPESPSWIHPSYGDRVRFRLDGEIELWAVGLGDQGTYEIETNYFDREPRNRDVEHFELRVVGMRSGRCGTGRVAEWGPLYAGGDRAPRVRVTGNGFAAVPSLWQM
ncbi:uncharacterized protein LOC144603059 isoform X2 [Rhinoraja longicauda]